MCKYELPMSKLLKVTDSNRQPDSTTENIYHAASRVINNVFIKSQFLAAQLSNKTMYEWKPVVNKIKILPRPTVITSP